MSNFTRRTAFIISALALGLAAAANAQAPRVKCVSFMVTVLPYASVSVGNFNLTVADGTSGTSPDVAASFCTNCPYSIHTVVSCYPTNGTQFLGGTGANHVGSLTLNAPLSFNVDDVSANDGTGQTGVSGTLSLSWTGSLDAVAGSYTGGVVTCTITHP